MSRPFSQSDPPLQNPENEPLPVVGLLIFFVGIAMMAYGITALWFGMREIMDVGGYCAEGGPYEIRQDCPDGAELLMLTGIPAGVIGVFVTLIGGGKCGRGAGLLALLGWPALFVSLGYNFIDYAISPPEGMGDPVGWWISGVIFGLMGLPALLGVPFLVRNIQPERRVAILTAFVLAVIAGVAFGIWVNSRVG